jgi:hypothetical protein
MATYRLLKVIPILIDIVYNLAAKVVFGNLIVLEKTEHTKMPETTRNRAVAFFLYGFIGSVDLATRLGQLPQPRNHRFDKICVTCGSSLHYWCVYSKANRGSGVQQESLSSR